MKKIIPLLLCVFIIVTTFTALYSYSLGKVNYYISTIKKYSTQSISASMIAAIIRVESNFDPLARSNKGAIGLMQLLPKTAEYVAQIFKIGYDESDLLDGEKNIQIGVLYLSYLLDRFSLEWVIVAYNAGETITKKWIESGVSLNKIPYKETRDYYKKVVRAMKLYEFSGY